MKKIRKIHRFASGFLAFYVVVIASTGILLGWKKNSSYLQPKTIMGTSSNFSDWKSIDTLYNIAIDSYKQTYTNKKDVEISRVEIDKNKGVMKFNFDKNYHTIHVDCSTGEVLLSSKRYSDLIENIHDASIIDKLLKTNNQNFKVIYTTIMGISLIVFSVTGFWLWISRKKNKR